MKSYIMGFFGGFTALLMAGVIFIFAAVIFANNVDSVSSYDNLNVASTDSTAGEIYEQSLPGVVSVLNYSETSDIIAQLFDLDSTEYMQSLGSGFIFQEKGGEYYAFTNYHVVDGATKIKVALPTISEGEEDYIDADIVGVSQMYDVAVIKFKTNEDVKVLTLGDSSELSPGDTVYAIGSPFGLEFEGSITQGIVSAPIREYEQDGVSYSYIQTDAAINPGNSGGPLLNAQGEVVGINSMKITGEDADNIGLAIPINNVEEIVGMKKQ